LRPEIQESEGKGVLKQVAVRKSEKILIGLRDMSATIDESKNVKLSGV
jgi:hypothetical protein